MDDDRGRGAVAWLALAWLASALGVCAGLALGRGPLDIVLITALTPSAAAALVVVVVVVRGRTHPPTSRRARGARHRAAVRVCALEARLAALHQAGRAADLTRGLPLVLELHRARLSYARQVLREDGDLPSPLADELLEQHRALRELVDRSLAHRRSANGP